ncbi:MAG: carboxypeptidase regulatory-like domain-containing protein [Planctomycetes bacterium]|nr:carboxypeptidase regulatory-like domain-containing protein [Planctomycetota bacterium]
MTARLVSATLLVLLASPAAYPRPGGAAADARGQERERCRLLVEMTLAGRPMHPDRFGVELHYRAARDAAKSSISPLQVDGAARLEVDQGRIAVVIRQSPAKRMPAGEGWKEFHVVADLAGRKEAELRFALDATPVSGRIVDTAGRPVRKLHVTLELAKPRGEFPVPVRIAFTKGTETDGEGRFKLENLLPGEYRLAFAGHSLESPAPRGRAPDFLIKRGVSRFVAAGPAEVALGEIVIDPLDIPVPILVRMGQVPVAGAEVTAVLSSESEIGGRKGSVEVRTSGKTGGDGKYAMTLPAGALSIDVAKPGAFARARSFVRLGSRRDSCPVDCVLPAEGRFAAVRGSVAGASELPSSLGKVDLKWFVTVSRSPKSPIEAGRFATEDGAPLREDGSFEISGVIPGPYLVLLRARMFHDGKEDIPSDVWPGMEAFVRVQERHGRELLVELAEAETKKVELVKR